MTLKLYVWENVLTDYTDGVMFALAESVEQARGLLLAGCSYLPQQDLMQEPKEYTTPVAFDVWGGG
jgi:hypothetical protein